MAGASTQQLRRRTDRYRQNIKSEKNEVLCFDTYPICRRSQCTITDGYFEQHSNMLITVCVSKMRILISASLDLHFSKIMPKEKRYSQTFLNKRYYH